jgi:enoyl-CoA hydratase/carnithine racemase
MSKQLFLTGERISAQRAKEIGFLTEIAESETELGIFIK